MTFLISCYHHDNHDYHHDNHVHDNKCHVQGAGSSVEQLDLPLGVQQGGGEGGYRAGDHHDHDGDEDGDHHDHDEDEDDASNEKYDYGGGFGGWVAIKTC